MFKHKFTKQKTTLFKAVFDYGGLCRLIHSFVVAASVIGRLAEATEKLNLVAPDKGFNFAQAHKSETKYIKIILSKKNPASFRSRDREPKNRGAN